MKTNLCCQIFVPGINQIPNDAANWDGKAQTWSNLHPFVPESPTVDDVIVADRADYFCGIIGRAFFQQKRIERVKAVISKYAAREFRLSIAAHSNGTDLTLKGLAQLGWPRVEALHLFSGACEADFEKNGLNYALRNHFIGRVWVYVAGQDMALRAANLLVGRWLGYGHLGLHGGTNIDVQVREQVTTAVCPTFGHSTWFAPENFENTMNWMRRT